MPIRPEALNPQGKKYDVYPRYFLKVWQLAWIPA
jgi:hypothetical protein